MNYAYDSKLGKWVVLDGDLVRAIVDTEAEAEMIAKNGGEYIDEMYNDDYDHTGGAK